MKQNQVIPGDDRPAEAGADLLTPQNPRPGRGPLLVERRAGIHPVPSRAKELRPVSGGKWGR
jgi:hypothetical protein